VAVLDAVFIAMASSLQLNEIQAASGQLLDRSG
jgi:hypothetical protein